MATRKTTPFAEAPTEAPPLVEVPKSLADITDGASAQAWMEDKVVRAVRDAGHCGEALTIMDKVFGHPLDTVGVYDTRGVYGSNSGSQSVKRLYHAYLDSDGRDCWGNEWRSTEGHDRTGFDMEGFDRDGFGKNGRDRAGFDRDGKDPNGYTKDDPARFAYDMDGYTKDGYNKDGFDRQGFNREGVSAAGLKRVEPVYAFDADGYDADGWTSSGYGRNGSYSEEAAVKYYEARRAARRGVRR